jgi:hypothetical protein
MLKNRSVPTDTLLPHFICRDVAHAIAWLIKAFGFHHLRNTSSLCQYSPNSRTVGKPDCDLKAVGMIV